jgi:hypothetical protein
MMSAADLYRHFGDTEFSERDEADWDKYPGW